jgi:two-component system CheB/CheR fusion protein
MTSKCPIVGIGASAGGLDALKSFLNCAPADMGAAIVIIQHLDPSHPSLTPDILARHTKMPVMQITKNTKIAVNHVYVIPPNANLTLKGSKFELEEIVLQRGLRLPIDGFFSSLAEQNAQTAVGIILSGTGSDGTAGLREIKGAGGVVLVQTPETAQFDGMPRSAIATGLVDVICPVEHMPARIKDYLSHKHIELIANMDDGLVSPDDEGHLKSIIALLAARLGHDFKGYKKGTLRRRIARRMGLRNIRELSDYLTYLKDNDEEAEQLYRDFLINVTSFFRDPDAFEALEARVMTKLIEEKADKDQIRVWVPGCSTGEEAYSIAMLLIEKCEAAKKNCSIQVFASDIDDLALAVGRNGIYSANLVASIPPERLRRFFTKVDGGYRVSKELRETVMFASQNLVTDPPFSKQDLISCRNLLIYLEGNLQDKIIGYFHFALVDRGHLFLGRSEGTSQLAGLFEPIDKKSRIYRKLASAQTSVVSFPTGGIVGRVVADIKLPRPRPKETVRLRELMQQQLLRNYAPAAVLTNAKHQVLYFMGPTAHFLEQPSGVPTQDLLSLAPAELRKNLRLGLKKAVETTRAVVIENVSVRQGGVGRKVHIAIKPMTVPGETEHLFMVTFEDYPAGTTTQTGDAEQLQPVQPAAGDLEGKLRDAQEDLQITLEELETANEELQSSNEEMMSVNEELQSANEELETSKEELQAMNEELSTLNNQLKDKVEELATVNDDLTNFVSSTGIATLLLDTNHRIGRFTPASKRLFHLIDTDIGRSVKDIRQKFRDENFLQDIDAVLHEFRVIEREVVAEDGSSYFMRIAPYRAIEQRLGVVVVTFVDISQRLQNERKLKESEARFRNLFDNAPGPLILVDDGGKIALANSEAHRFFRFGPDEMIGLKLDELIPQRYRKQHGAQHRKYFEAPKVRPMGVGLELFAVMRNGEEIPVEIDLSPIETEDGVMACVFIKDISEHKQAVIAMKEAKTKADSAVAAKSRFLATASHDLRQPLQSLTMLSEALIQKVESPELVELGKQQCASLANMRSLLNSLLDISKLDTNGMEVVFEDVDLLSEVTQVCAGLQAEAEKKALTLTINVQARIVRSDPDLLKQVLQNLVGNAIRYTRQGGVEIVSSVVGDAMKIEVRDTGIGIPADQLSHIFEEFYQIGRDPQQGNVGLGLGLAIAHRVTEKLGSRIEVESEVGKGSVFSFELPLSRVLLPKKEPERHDEPVPAIGSSVVLLIDDDAAVLKSTKFRLSLQPGLEVFTAASPAEATRIIDEMVPRAPDIIVTDLHLGTQKNGLDVIEDTRKRAGSKIAAILISGDTALDKADLERRNIHVVFKPTAGNELIDTMARLLAPAK